MDIVGTGMVCSVGLSAASACAALRAKIAKFDELPFADDQGEPVVGAAVPGLGFDLAGLPRLVEMLSTALGDCLASVDVGRTERIPLLVGLAEPDRPGVGGDWPGSIVPAVEARLKVRFHPVRSAVVSKGHTSGFEALRAAREALLDPAVPACLVCGVDSYLDADALRWLMQHWRLKTPENSDGVIPGEAAACALVVRPESSPRGGCVARVAGVGFGREAASILTDEPLLGLGLTEAARGALSEAGLRMHEIDYRISDVAGESYGFREQALLLSRLIRVRREFLPLWHSADSIGDTGAAAGVCQLVMAQHAFRGLYSPGRRAMGFTSAVSGGRACVVIERQPAEAADPVKRSQ